MIYRIGNASATLCAGLALILGYKKDGVKHSYLEDYDKKKSGN